MSLHGPMSITCTSAEELLLGGERTLLEEVLPAYLEAKGWLSGALAGVHVTESLRVEDDGASVVLTFVRAEYTEGEAESFVLPLLVALTPRVAGQPGTLTTPLPVSPLGSIVANLHVGDGAEPQTGVLLEASNEVVSRAMLSAVARAASFRSARGALVASPILGASLEDHADRDARVVSTDRLGASVAYGHGSVVRLFSRVEEGSAPELEVGRFLQSKGLTGITPQVLGFVEYRVARAEPVTLAVVEEFVANEGTAWQQARGELGRAYERVLAQPAEGSGPELPAAPLLELAYMDPPDEHRELLGTYRDWATLLGRRTAELHLALASGTEPAFEPHAYSAMDQRSKYQTARNLIGRVLASVRRSMSEMPASLRPSLERLVASEERILARFEPILTARIDAKQIRYHGDMHLGRALFTGKDYVFLGVGGGRDRRLSERRRKGAALRDVAGMLRSFHYAAATTLQSLRPEDQAKGEPWSWVWQRWASAAYVRGYLEVARDAPFVPRTSAMVSILLEATMLEKAFAELRRELARRPEMAWIPLQGILRMIDVD